MKTLDNEDLGQLFLRLTIASLMLFHGIGKILHGIGPVENIFISHGLPSFFAYGAYIGEVLAPIMLILGIKVRLAAFLIIFTMITAIALTQINDIFTITKYSAWAIELQMFYILTSIVIMISGGGRFVLVRKR